MHSSLWVIILAVLVVSCGGGSSGTGSGNTDVPPPHGGVAQFTVIPTQPVAGQSLTALGNLNPPGHVLPTDHVYFYSWNLAASSAQPQPGTRDVYMPATGAVYMVLKQQVPEYKIGYRVTNDFYFYFDHLIPNTVPKVGDTVFAGTLVGTTSPDAALDLGAFDASVSHSGFLNLTRYTYQTLHFVSPWQYFTADLQARLYPQVYRMPSESNKDGRCDYGIAGKLVGDWFLHGLSATDSQGSAGQSKTLAFVYDYYDPSQVRISVGGTVGAPGVWAVDPAAPRPEVVSVASGPVAYQLFNSFQSGMPAQGLLLVQMLSDSQIKVQMWTGALPFNPAFDSSATIYDR